MQESALIAQVVEKLDQERQRALHKAHSYYVTHIECFHLRLDLSQISHHFIFKGGKQVLFATEVVVERATVEIGGRAQVVYRNGLEALFFDEGYKSRTKRFLAARDATVFGAG